MKRSILAVIILSASIGAGGALLAQTSEIDSPRERLRTFIEDRKQTRPRRAPPPIGVKADRDETANVDWEAARQLMTQTERRRLAQFSDVTATRAVTFQRVQGVRAASAENMQQVHADEVAIVTIPVLIPELQRIRDTVQIIGQRHAYTAIAEVDDGVSMRMSGTRKRLRLERAPAPRREALIKQRSARPPLPGVDANYVITRSVSSTDLSFSRFNVGYVLSLMCDEPDTDVRCTEDAFITELASSLALLNPEAGEGQ